MMLASLKFKANTLLRSYNFFPLSNPSDAPSKHNKIVDYLTFNSFKIDDFKDKIFFIVTDFTHMQKKSVHIFKNKEQVNY